jgi:transglutaminase-like putative cysteine protease
MRKLQIDHTTLYRFATPVTLLPHRLIQRPRENHNVRVVASQLTITPAHTLHWQRDALDNSIAVATFSVPSNLLSIASRLVVEHHDEQPLNFLVDERARYHPFTYDANDAPNLAPFLAPIWLADQVAIGAWLGALGLTSRLETFTLLDRLNRTICNDLRYQQREEQGVQSPAQTLSLGSGSCRDYAALFMEACRHLGLAARFVSGYHTSYENEPGNGSTHAWAEVYLPGAGWRAFDPSAGVLAGSQHIAVASARHPEMVAPVSGSYLGPAHPLPEMEVSVRVIELGP